MSATTFRDATVVVVETSRDVVRAIHGLHELLQKPSVEIPARVGLPRSAVAASNGEPSTLNGAGLPGVRVQDYLVGSQLDDALAAGQDLVVSYPFANGAIHDWTQAEALWKHLFARLGLKRALNESPVMLTIFPGLPRSAHEQLAQLFFERFNFAAFAILERPLAQLYATSVLSGVVVDLGRTHTDISPIYDCIPISAARTTLPVGTDDCERYLASLLRANTSVMAALSLDDPGLPAQLVRLAGQIWRAGLIRVGDAAEAVEEEGVTDIAAVLVAGKEKAVIESGMRKRQNAKASAAELARAKEIEALDLVTLTFEDKEVSVGKERHRFCDPLFNPALLQGLPELGDTTPLAERSQKTGMPARLPSLQELVGHSIGLTEVDQRQYFYQGLLVTGDVTNKIRGLGSALQARLSSFVLGNPDPSNDIQPKQVNSLKIPEYFAEYRESGDGFAAFLGASIVAKITLNDPHTKNFVSKADYTTRGPHAVIEMSPALL